MNALCRLGCTVTKFVRCAQQQMLYAVLPKSVHYYWNACWLSIFGRKKVYMRRYSYKLYMKSHILFTNSVELSSLNSGPALEIKHVCYYCYGNFGCSRHRETAITQQFREFEFVDISSKTQLSVQLRLLSTATIVSIAPNCILVALFVPQCLLSKNIENTYLGSSR